MNVTVEKTPRQTLSRFVLNNVNYVNITHLPIHSLDTVVYSCDELNQSVGTNKAIPHVAARNIKSMNELDSFIEFSKRKKINKALVIGGAIKKSNVFENAYDVARILRNEGFHIYCGLYPQSEKWFPKIENKLNFYNGGITQLCFDTDTINELPLNDKIRIGISSISTPQGIYKYLKLCGEGSWKYIFQNWRAIKYISHKSFKINKLLSAIKFDKYHIYNFGKLEQTIEEIHSYEY